MKIPLYAHQEKIIREDRKKCGLWIGTGGAKTRTALHLAEGKTLVICPKQQREDRTWQLNAEKFDITLDLTVISKEDLRSTWHELPAYDTVIFDEVHTGLGVMPDTRQRGGKTIPKTSQIFEAFLWYLQKFPPKRLYLCSATPCTKPMQLWAIATLLGQSWDFTQFRDLYYTQIRVGGRAIFVPRKSEELQQRMRDKLKAFGYTGSLQDFFDVPEQTHREVYIDLTGPQKNAIKGLMMEEADPMVRRARIRTIENGVLYGKEVVVDGKEEAMKNKTILFPSNKIDYILDRAEEFPKLLIFANYTAQIEQTAEVLRKGGYHVLTLTGKTEDRGELILEAERLPACIVIAQSTISSGYELPSFPCVIFASKSWQYVAYEQGLGRVLRANKLKKNLYIHLIVKGGPDEDCHKAIMSGQDFVEKLTTNL